MKAEEKVKKINCEENIDEEDEEEEEIVPSTSKAEKDKMVEGQQKKKVEIAKIKVKLNILRDDLENAIRDKDFLKAQDVQLDVEDLDTKLINLNEELALMVIPPSVEKRVKTKARTEASAPAETQQGLPLRILTNKKFMLDAMTQRTASKFAIFLEYENPHSFFILCYYFIFSLNECRHSMSMRT